MTKGVKCRSMMVPARHKELLKTEHENPPKMSLAFYSISCPFRQTTSSRQQPLDDMHLHIPHHHKKILPPSPHFTHSFSSSYPDSQGHTLRARLKPAGSHDTDGLCLLLVSLEVSWQRILTTSSNCRQRIQPGLPPPPFELIYTPIYT